MLYTNCCANVILINSYVTLSSLLTILHEAKLYLQAAVAPGIRISTYLTLPKQQDHHQLSI